MAEDWLAAWDAASEEDRRLVLATVGDRVTAQADPDKTYRRMIVPPSTFVIAARRVGAALVVATCSHFRDSIDDATAGIPVIETDYHYVHVEIDELVVDNGEVTAHEILFSDEIFHLEPGPDEPYPPDDGPEVREVADKFLITYPALSHVRIKTLQECEQRSLGEWCAKAPRISVLAAVPDGARHSVTILATFVIWHSTQSEEWGVQYLTIDEVVVEHGAVVGETRRVTEHIEIAPRDLDTHDDVATTREVVTKFLAGCKDWRVTWYAADEQERSVAQKRAAFVVNAEVGVTVRDQLAENWVDADPEVIAARRDGKQLIARFAWWYWIGNLDKGSEQSIGIVEITVEDSAVVRERHLARTAIAVTVPREHHHALKTYRDELVVLRDRAAAIAHVEARLRRDCKQAALDRSEYVIREPEVRIVRVAGRVFITCGWYRLGIPEQVGRDRVHRTIEVDAITVEEGLVVDARSLGRTWGQMSEQDSDDEVVGNRLDNEHVNQVIDAIHKGVYG